MLVREEKKRPPTWQQRWQRVRRRWTLPFHAIEWSFDWTAYGLSRWAFLEVLEYLGIFSVLGRLFSISRNPATVASKSTITPGR
jgi:hypothetical protein